MSEEKSPEVVVDSTSDHSNSNDLKFKAEDEYEHYMANSNKWYDKGHFGLPPYSHAIVQIVMVAFVCFMTPGMFNALSGIGGGGISDISVADNANVALYSTFASVGFFSGTICNKLGVKWTLAFGSTGYALYASSLLCYYHTQNGAFVIFAGAFLGVAAACLWAAQGVIILSYPGEYFKGKAIMIFWIIFNLGAVIGSIIPLANNIDNKGSSVGDGTYAAFLALMCVGFVLATTLLPADKVWRGDKTRVIPHLTPTWKTELFELWNLLKTEPRIILLFPMFFASNWFYTYQGADFNAGKFNIRTRSLNSLLYWFLQIVGAGFVGFFMDWKRFSRKTRARVGWVFLFVLTNVIWGGGLKFQNFTRESVKEVATIDFKDGSYIGPMFLYMFYGMYDAVWQTYIYWIMGALSNNPRKSALYAGFYKGIQSAGAAIVWRLDAIGTSYMSMFASSWGLLDGALVIAAPLVFLYIQEHSETIDDIAEQNKDIEGVKEDSVA